MIAQIGGQVADPQPPGLARRPRGQRLAVDPFRRGVVGLRESQHHLRLDVEVQQQVQQHFQAVGELQLALHAEGLVAQSVEIPFDLLEIAEVLAHLERLNGERQRVGAVRLETPEVRDPCIEPARTEQNLAQVLVCGHVFRIGREHGLVSGDRRIRDTLLLEEHAEVVVGVDQRRLERQRPLIGPRRFVERTLHLQRDAVVVVRIAVVRIEGERTFERGGRRGAVGERELRHAQRAPQA